MSYYKRSPFLFTYWSKNNKIIIFNYNRYTKAVVSKQILKILDVLSEWRDIHEISNKVKLDRKIVSSALERLTSLKIIHKNNATDQDDTMHFGTAWDPIDLAMQRQRSHGGRFPMSIRVGESPRPIKRLKGISSVRLPKPRNRRQYKNGLLDVLEQRKSVRRYAKNYISLEELSHFLYHSSRIKKILRSGQGTLTRRPYPSGGSRYPLEIYVMNNRIGDIQKGIYYYDPLKHHLNLLNKNKNYQEKFNKFVINVVGPNMEREPDVIFIITAVFARTMWKYDKLGLSLILSDLGCLYQTMYLIATEMRLGPCPVGKTYEELVKKWLKLNWFEESHVGTFMLGVPERT